MNHGNSEVKDEWNHQRKRPKQELCLGLGKPWANVSKDETLLMRSVRKFHVTIYLDQTSLSKLWASLHRGLNKPVNQELDTTLIKPPKKTLDTSEQPPRNSSHWDFAQRHLSKPIAVLVQTSKGSIF